MVSNYKNENEELKNSRQDLNYGLYGNLKKQIDDQKDVNQDLRNQMRIL